MKRFALLFLLLSAVPVFAANWYVDPVNGGTRYDASTTPTGQCNGQSASAYVSGVNQPCPYKDARALWNDPNFFQSQTWVIAGGDTVTFKNCAAQVTTGGGCIIAGSYDASASGKPCFGLSINCVPPDPPAGTAMAPTTFLGENAGNCSTTVLHPGASYPDIIGDPAKQSYIYGVGGASYVWSHAATHDIVYSCIMITDQSHCGAEIDCHGFTDYANYGFDTGNNMTALNGDITLTDVTIQGMGAQGWHGNMGGAMNFTHVFFYMDGQTGIDLDPDGHGEQSTTGSMNFHYVSIGFIGCPMEFPPTSTIPIAIDSGRSCGSQSTSPISITGDGIGTPVTQMASILLDHVTSFYNTQDGIDIGHVYNSTVTFSNTQIYGNMGGNGPKMGPQQSVSLSNLLITGNCLAMLSPIPGAPTGFNAALGADGCRAGGDQFGVNMLPTAIEGNGTFTASGTAITGTSTLFTDDCAVGGTLGWIEAVAPFSNFNAYADRRTIAAIGSDTSITLSAPFASVPTTSIPICTAGPNSTSSTAVTEYHVSYAGYGSATHDAECQAAFNGKQAPIDLGYCGGYSWTAKDNIFYGYTNTNYNDEQAPSLWTGFAPTVEDYNNCFAFRGSTQCVGAHDVSTDPLFQSEPANPITAESQLYQFLFPLTASSPGKYAGVAIGGQTTDFLGNAWASTPSMGGLEVLGASGGSVVSGSSVTSGVVSQ